MSAVVAATDLVVVRGGRRALDGISFGLHAGSALAVIGSNGSGKSTLLQAVAGLVEPAAGSVTVAPAVALVLQSTTVDPSLPITVRDTVRLGRYPSVGLLRRFGRADHESVDAAMERLRVDDLAGRSLHELSGGQRQRVLVAQGLAQGAEVLLLDEPATGLDLPSRQIILDLVDELRAEGTSVIMATHDLADANHADQVLLLRAGRPVALGPPEDVLGSDELDATFGSSVMTLPDGRVLVDDPHHHHHHHDEHS